MSDKGTVSSPFVLSILILSKYSLTALAFSIYKILQPILKEKELLSSSDFGNNSLVLIGPLNLCYTVYSL